MFECEENHLGFEDDGKGWIRVTYHRQRQRRQKSSHAAGSQEEVAQQVEREAGDHQDWSRVVLKRVDRATVRQQIRREGVHQLKGERTTTEALAPGQMRRLEQSDMPPKRKELSSESRRKIQQIRFGMGFTQDELNAMCALPVNTIREIEAGHLCPNPKQLASISNQLKTSLKYDWA
jgi:ribosome-binding protein aMBF1 (putative translation factor)